MSEKTENDLAELIAHEQRGFRRILFAGVATLIVLVVMSAALGVYYYFVAQNLSRTSFALERQAFEARRRVDAQNNRISDQEIAIRRAYDDIRGGGVGAGGASPQQTASALASVEAFLLNGRRLTLSDERVVYAVGRGEATSASASLFSGVADFLEFDARNEAFDTSKPELPTQIAHALKSFEDATNDARLAPAAWTGVAWVWFRNATARAYEGAACRKVFDAVAAISNPGAQPLYWRAQCERKMGLTEDSLAHYAEALRVALARTDNGNARNLDDAERTILMNAFHGVGTTLISGFDLPESNLAVAHALEIARAACPLEESSSLRSPRMRIALSCLNQAIALRADLRQTPNQRSGSAENISFAHLRDNDFEDAFANARNVEKTGLFAWNELVRALSSAHLKNDQSVDAEVRAEAADANGDALRNVSFFDINQYNVCEIEALLSPELYAEASRILAQTHRGQDVSCKKAA